MTRPAERARQHRKRIVRRLAFAASLVVIVFVAGTFAVVGIRQPHPDKQPYAVTRSDRYRSSSADVGHVESKILFVGDMFWGRAVNKWAQASPLKEAYPFSRLHEFNRSHYDAWVGNLECPSVPGVNQPYAQEVQSLLFNCPSTYLPEAAKWFTAVSLANNHTANQGGQPGIDATRRALADNNIQYFGHFDPNILPDVCEVVAMPARIVQDKKPVQTIKIPVALCGYHGLSTIPTAASLAVMQQYSKYMPVIAYPHMGVEYTAEPTAAQQNLYRAMIDNGADAVLAGHPHWVQPAEAYKGKLIVYSMGNFMFDQGAGETQRGAAIDLQLVTNENVPLKELSAWGEIGEHCTAFHDDCLRRITKQAMHRLPWKFAYTARGVDMSGRVTHPADQDIAKTILERLDWAAVQQGLHAAQ